MAMWRWPAVDFNAVLRYTPWQSGTGCSLLRLGSLQSDCGAPFSCWPAAGNWSMFYLQMFSSRFERGVLGLLGTSVVCVYLLGAVMFTIPGEAPKPPSYELAEVGPEDGRRQTPRSSGKALLAKRVLPAPEIVHGPLFGRPAEVALLGQIKTAHVAALQVVSARELDQKLSALDYSLSDIRRGSAPVPRLQLANLPPDLAEIHSAKQRKRLFIKFILPLVLQANEKILSERRKLLELLSRDGARSQGEEEWLAALADRYDGDPIDLEALVPRVDVVPPSLAIAQAAEESGWGTSRFAVEANAVFGQWTFRKGTGVVPARRDAGKRHEVRSFEGLRHSVAAYMHNLNIHWAYKEFRRVREELRESNSPLTGKVLAGTLKKYSERGLKYIKTIRTIMRVNGLSAFDRARLQETDPPGFGT